MEPQTVQNNSLTNTNRSTWSIFSANKSNSNICISPSKSAFSNDFYENHRSNDTTFGGIPSRITQSFHNTDEGVEDDISGTIGSITPLRKHSNNLVDYEPPNSRFYNRFPKLNTIITFKTLMK